MKKVPYIFLLNSNGQDYFSTSYEHDSIDELSTRFTILDFSTEHLGDYEYLVIDRVDQFHLSYDSFWETVSKRYLTLENVQFFKIKDLDFDADRRTMVIIAEPSDSLDIDKYKRHCRITRIIES